MKINVAGATEMVSNQLVGMADEDNEVFETYELETGGILLRAPSGECFHITITAFPADSAARIFEEAKA